ncbi:Uncharacterised protein [Vibrio cholerae]|nr:Uncharacterised protein [Vibrio cholerae]
MRSTPSSNTTAIATVNTVSRAVALRLSRLFHAKFRITFIANLLHD